MKTLILLFLPCFSLAASTSPAPFPVFLKSGFSSILEFEDAPTKVVLGDGQTFQVEKLDRSLVIKTLAPYGTTNMFVYFRSQEPKLFVLTASEDAEPTYYKKFEPPITAKLVTKTKESEPTHYQRDARIVSCKFDGKKDYLTVEVILTADAKEPIKPQWNLVRLGFNKAFISPMKLWAERKDVQKDTKVKARFIFAKPNIPRNLKNVSLIIPTVSSLGPINLWLDGGKK